MSDPREDTMKKQWPGCGLLEKVRANCKKDDGKNGSILFSWVFRQLFPLNKKNNAFEKNPEAVRRHGVELHWPGNQRIVVVVVEVMAIFEVSIPLRWETQLHLRG